VVRGGVEGLRRREDWGDVNNVLCKSNRNSHYESPLHNECILIFKNIKKKREKQSHIPSLLGNISFIPEFLKREKEIPASFAGAPQTASYNHKE
jgi:hypothetical protein